jgi:predicted aspartyl protease
MWGGTLVLMRQYRNPFDRVTITAARIASAAFIIASLDGIGVEAAAASECSMAQIAEWPTHYERGGLVIDGTLNAQEVGVKLDTGSQRSLVLGSAAERFNLIRRQIRGGLLVGFGGETYDDTAVVDEFKIGSIGRKNWQVPVTNAGGFGRNVAVVLGEDVLQKTDVEFDLAHSVVRLFQSLNCSGVSLAYWATGGASEVGFEAVSETGPQIVLTVYLNGQPMKALLHSGTNASVVNRLDAARLGITPDSPGVVRTGNASDVGNRSVESWVGPFNSFAIGDETIKDANIAVADLSWMSVAYTPLGSGFPQNVGWTPSMVLGADFLRAHRLLIAHSQRKLYFTHNGGVVFQPPKPARRPAGSGPASGIVGPRPSYANRETYAGSSGVPP